MKLEEIIEKSNEFIALKKDFNKNNLNQSLLVIGEDFFYVDEFVKNLCAIIADNKEKVFNLSHPDVVYFPQDEFKGIVVKDIEEIIEKSLIKPAEAENKVFIINIDNDFDPRSQNKLLKILEEPPKNLYFIIKSRSKSHFLPTILSRVSIIALNQLTKSDFEKLGYTKKQYALSNGKLEILNYLEKDEKSKKVYNDCVNALENLKSSEDIMQCARIILKKEEANKIINTFKLIFEQILKEKLSGNAEIYENLAKEYSLLAISNIVKALEIANAQLIANCSAQAVLDCLIIKIIKEKIKWQKKD